MSRCAGEGTGAGMGTGVLGAWVSAGVLGLGGLAAPAFAADDVAAPSVAAAPTLAARRDTGRDTGRDTLADIVVTAASGSRSGLDSSVSVSSVDAGVIQDFHPVSEGDMLRLLPGLQPNISGPGGNGNFAVRGLPVATGGAPFVQLQEDGLPTVLYGDIQFGNNDYFTRPSPTDERVEAIRGGTASTLASQAPGAVVNHISKTSGSQGGFVEIEEGANYDYTKLDFLDSGIINDTMHYNLGGFYDGGHGPRHAAYNVSNSFQIKGNITKEFGGDRGFFRLYFKLADTQEPNDTGGLICGTIAGAKAANIGTCPGFDIKAQSNYSRYNSTVSYVDYGTGGLVRTALNGIATRQRAVQGRLHYDFDGITLDENARYNAVSGGFASNFLSISPISGLPTPPGGRAVYAAGPNAGQTVTDAYYNSNVEVYTHIRDVGSFVNDAKLAWQGGIGGRLAVNLTTGWFFMRQRMAMDWHPGEYLSQATGANPAPIDLLDAQGNLVTANGYVGYNTNWGGCCARSYDYSFTDNAPYADLIVDYGRFGLDGSIRHDINHGAGQGANADDANGHATTLYLAQTARNPVSGLPQTVRMPYYLADGATEAINDTVPLTSWSVGASYKPADNLNLFLRASKGTRFNSDRLTLGGNFNADGTLKAASAALASDNVYQYEIGLKARGELGAARFTAELTLYHSHFNVFTYELNPDVCQPLTGTATCPISDRYKTTGGEFYGTLRLGGLSLLANATYNKADKQPGATASAPNPVYSRSNGIPDLSYSLVANYDVLANASVGVDVTGVTSTLNSDGVEFGGSAVVGANVRISPAPTMSLGVNVYNLFDTLALLGPDNANEIVGAIIGGNRAFVGAASAVIGRTVTVWLKIGF